MKTKDAFRIAFCVAFIWCVVSLVRPYWDKHWLGEEIKNAAIYGTKNSIDDTRMLLTQKMEEKGSAFRGQDFYIEKDEESNVTIGITYMDEITIFGVVLKELEFNVEIRVDDVEPIF